MASKWYTKLKVPLKRCTVDFEGHPSSFKVKSLILTWIEHFRTVTLVWIHGWLWNYVQSLNGHRRGAVWGMIQMRNCIERLIILFLLRCSNSTMQVSGTVLKRVFNEWTVWYSSRLSCNTARTRSMWSVVSEVVRGPSDGHWWHWYGQFEVGLLQPLQLWLSAGISLVALVLVSGDRDLCHIQLHPTWFNPTVGYMMGSQGTRWTLNFETDSWSCPHSTLTTTAHKKFSVWVPGTRQQKVLSVSSWDSPAKSSQCEFLGLASKKFSVWVPGTPPAKSSQCEFLGVTGMQNLESLYWHL